MNPGRYRTVHCTYRDIYLSAKGMEKKTNSNKINKDKIKLEIKSKI